MSMTPARDANNFLFFRYLFALLVVLSHAFELVAGDRSTEPLTSLFHTISFGELAVDGFFLLSGYLIFKSWHLDPRPFSFLRKRVLRIYPGFIVAAAVCLFIVAPLGTTPAEFERVFQPGRFVQEILTLQAPSTPSLTFARPNQAINGSMWSISFEFKCYLAVLLMGVTGLIRKPRVLAAGFVALLGLFVLMTVCIKLNIVAEIFGKRPLTNIGNYLMVRMLCLFVAGGLFHVFRAQIVFNWTGFWVAAIALLISLHFRFVAEAGLAVFGAYLLFFLAFRDVPALRTFRALPDASYGLYLYAWPIQQLVMWKAPALSAIPVFLLTSALALVAGLISWYLIEKPCLRLK